MKKKVYSTLFKSPTTSTIGGCGMIKTKIQNSLITSAFKLLKIKISIS